MPGTVYLSFHQGIDPQSVNRFMTLCTQILQQYQPQKLYILFSSGGGSVDSGVTLYNFLRGLSCEIVTHNIGSIDSIANAIFLAGKDRYATPNSAFLFHGVTWGFAQGANLTYPQMQETLSRFDAAEQLFAGILVDRTKFQAEEVRELFRQGESRDPSFAKSKGVIHDIKDVSIEPGAPVFSVPA
jgi:ATP-dependent Clp protease protease subunit